MFDVLCVFCAVRWSTEILPSSRHFAAAGHDQNRHSVSWCQLENDGPTTDGHPDKKISARFACFLQSVFCHSVFNEADDEEVSNWVSK